MVGPQIVKFFFISHDTTYFNIFILRQTHTSLQAYIVIFMRCKYLQIDSKYVHHLDVIPPCIVLGHLPIQVGTFITFANMIQSRDSLVGWIPMSTAYDLLS